MYTTDYIRLEKKARENDLLDELNNMAQDALEQTMEEYGEMFHVNSEGEITGNKADEANRRHAEILEEYLNEAIFVSLKQKVYNSIATYNGDPFICEDEPCIEDVALTIKSYGLIPARDFANAIAKLDLADTDKYEVDAIYETPNGELTICFSEDITLL